MGYDITFHPISEKELDHFVFETFSNRGLISDRINSLTSNEVYRDFLKKTYDQYFSDCDIKQHIDCLAFSRLGAIISSFLHPYWYTRNESISFLVDDNVIGNIFHPISNFTNNKELVSRLSLGDLACYLGITQVSLSRIRAKK